MGVRQQRLVFALIFFATATLALAEIHRAKGISKKHVPKIDKRDYVASSTKDILKLDISEEAESKLLAIKFDTWIYSVCCAVLVGLSGIFPLLVIPIEAGPSLKHGAPAAHLKLLLSFAVGGLLGDVFLHLLPEAWQHLNKGYFLGGHDHDGHVSLGLWVITGMLSFLIIEKIFAKEDEFEHLADECEEKEETKHMDLKCHSNGTENTGDRIASRTTFGTKRNKSINTDNQCMHMNNGTHKNVGIEKESDKQNSIKVSGYLNLTANVIDNFTHGLAVAGGFLISNKVGCITTLAILLHEIPHEVGDFAILLRSGFDRWSAAKAQLLTAMGGLVGALTALTADSAQAAGESTAWILPFTSGGFIYIALVTIVPDVIEEKHARESAKQVLCLLAGIGVMYLVTMVQ